LPLRKLLYENRDIKSSSPSSSTRMAFESSVSSKGGRLGNSRLIDLLKRTDTINQLEDDIVTLIWEKDFVHISYLATDDFLEETPVVIPDNVAQFRRSLIFRPVAHQVEVDPPEGEEEVDVTELLSRVAEEPPMLASNRSVYFLTPDEVEGCGRRLKERLILPSSSTLPTSFSKSWRWKGAGALSRFSQYSE